VSVDHLPAGVTLRPVDADGPDIDAAFTVADSHERAVLGSAETTRDELAALLTGPISPHDGQLLAWRGDRPVGLLSLEVDRTRREAFAEAYVDPAAEERAALLAALVAHAVAYGREVAAIDPAPGVPDDVSPYEMTPLLWQVLAGSYEQDVAYADALRANGLRPIRRHWQMHLDLAAAGTAAADPAPPQGVTRLVARAEDEVRQFHGVYADSFRDHYGAGPLPLDDWLLQVRALPGVDPERWWLALAGDVPVGMCMVDDSRAEFGDSYVRTLGVTRAARGRGIARWLLGCAFADAVRRGRTGIALTVDSSSLTGATRLYEGMGMSVRRAIDAWCLPV
jgi:ribosomal protein S18 acetylase RimI-like enzyme